MAGQFDEQMTRKYLLGQLGDDALQEIEKGFLIDDQAFEELLATEADLTDEYLSGTLTNDERARFEQHCLATPEGQQNLRFARAFSRYAAKAAGQKRAVPDSFLTRFWSNQTWGLRAAVAFGVVVIIFGALWFFPRSPQTFQAVALTFSINNNRAQGVQAAKIKLTADALKLSLKLPDSSVPAVRYRVALDNLDNQHTEPRSLEPAAQDAQSLSVIIPAAQLARGRYALKLLAIKSDGAEQRINGAYYFDVE
jgi:methionine-rich copper-binding protein CopC